MASRLIQISQSSNSGNFVPINDNTKIYVQSAVPLGSEGDCWIESGSTPSQAIWRYESGNWRSLAAQTWANEVSVVSAGRFCVLPLRRGCLLMDGNVYWQSTSQATTSNCYVAQVFSRTASNGSWTAGISLTSSAGVNNSDIVTYSDFVQAIPSTVNALAVGFTAVGNPGPTRFAFRLKVYDFR